MLQLLKKLAQRKGSLQFQGSGLSLPTQKREHHKPLRIANEKTKARIYEVLKLNSPYCFSKKRRKKNHSYVERKNEKQQDALEEIQKMQPARGKKSPCSLGCMKKQKKYEEEDGSGGEETTFPLTAKHCSSLIRFLLLPMSKCFHGSL